MKQNGKLFDALSVALGDGGADYDPQRPGELVFVYGLHDTLPLFGVPTDVESANRDELEAAGYDYIVADGKGWRAVTDAEVFGRVVPKLGGTIR